MKPTRLALIAALTTCLLWSAKAAAIAAAGGLGKSPLEGPLFLLGLIACVSSAALLGLALVRSRARFTRALGVVGGVVVASVYGSAEGAVLAAVQPVRPSWVWGEINLWVLMLSLLVVAALLWVRQGGASNGAVPAA